ncbi:hypothetical protein IMG5_071400 [Ichthyophthirius multifiliis]|uniref:GAF domain-containing protein n=1 Tax=Ichthyophthirius multifiliis TaxID=5932 RepID=G0QPU7_ICHMU|nr:hypothetical protein IMG5_071400 [Ichthyophthirius multifiliis]EGR32759.1 hypothetical protein IMG5_071400 [Ichthyophthirius multifiliis]|eukprot:XP_004036745.1 hypothetical protein IMG5_071400 [Ichthyophthirius multifiliis]
MNEVQQMNDIKDIIMYANTNFAQIFNAQRCHLWIVEKQSGLLQTFIGNAITIKCIINKGLIGDVFYKKQAINSKTAKCKPLLFKIQNGINKEETEYVDCTLLIPIFCDIDNKYIKGILEISNSQNDLFSFDEEYLGIILSYNLSFIIRNIILRQTLESEIKFRQLLFDAYEQFIQCKDKWQFTIKVQQWIQMIFGVNLSVFYFIEDSKMISYAQNKEKQIFTYNHGLAGMVAKEMKPYIIHDIKSNNTYNQLVDLTSILPIYVVPLVSNEKKEVYGVIEIALKNQYKSKKEKNSLLDGYNSSYGMDENLTNIFNQFASLVMHAIKNNFFN